MKWIIETAGALLQHRNTHEEEEAQCKCKMLFFIQISMTLTGHQETQWPTIYQFMSFHDGFTKWEDFQLEELIRV